jgi:signal recognition particle GTPase
MFIASNRNFNRSGAVEQLRVHVRNLSMLSVNGAGDSKGRVELFERGYGKDAAGIAREAINYGMKRSSILTCQSYIFLFSVRP